MHAIAITLTVVLLLLVLRHFIMGRRAPTSSNYSATRGAPEYFLPDLKYHPPVVAGDLPRQYFPARRYRLTPPPKLENLQPITPDQRPKDVDSFPFPFESHTRNDNRPPAFAPLRN